MISKCGSLSNDNYLTSRNSVYEMYAKLVSRCEFLIVLAVGYQILQSDQSSSVSLQICIHHDFDKLVK